MGRIFAYCSIVYFGQGFLQNQPYYFWPFCSAVKIMYWFFKKRLGYILGIIFSQTHQATLMSYRFAGARDQNFLAKFHLYMSYARQGTMLWLIKIFDDFQLFLTIFDDFRRFSTIFDNFWRFSTLFDDFQRFLDDFRQFFDDFRWFSRLVSAKNCSFPWKLENVGNFTS
jgi:hypothetical protein